MHLIPRFAAALTLLSPLALPAEITTQPATHTPTHTFVRITLAPDLPSPLSGRLLLFAHPGTGATAVDIDQFHPSETAVAAIDLPSTNPGQTIQFDADTTAFPAPFSTLPPGDYQLQAVLDPDHTYNYSGRNPSDWQSPVLTLKSWSPGQGPEPTLTLTSHPADRDADDIRQAIASAKPNEAEKVEFLSPLLTRFWGKPTYLRAWVILPPNYNPHAKTTYPTLFWTAGFGGSLTSGLFTGLHDRKSMLDGQAPPMIHVMLDESCPQGTHEFANSVNNGPWGAALTTELIPHLEHLYRMDARPSGRFLNGHSSGGWATLQLQINYPGIFGGTWSTSPDASDFHNFTGPDLYAPGANVYHHADGTPWPIMRDKGHVLATVQQFAQLESVLGPFGGQMSSFDWVFSPRSLSGAPQPMFDRTTGNVDPTVVGYWHDHFDLAHLTEQNWPKNGPLLRGRIHLYVGTADTFYLDGSARLFEARLRALGADPHFTYIPDRTHFDLYTIGADRHALSNVIAAEMYAVARPNAHWHPAPPPPAK